MTRPLSFIAALSVGFVYAHPAQAGCEKDTDCKGERICDAGACVDPTVTAAPSGASEASDANEAEGSTEEPSSEPSEDATEDATDETSKDQAESSDDAPAEAATQAAESDPKNWWKQSARQAEAPVLQEIFNSMPRPIRKKGNAKLVYHRAVPLVVSDVHTTTTLWGGKGQTNVRFLGVSKVHSTTTMEPISETTPGIAYCPINCDRITRITADGEIISIMYDGEIKDWGGKASDVHAGYTRKVGKHHRAIFSFPVLYNLAPPSAWLDPEEVKAVQTSAIDEINRYCGR